jgi:hypothetical protein
MAFNDTIREQIIAAITTALEDIRTSAGYNLDMGLEVKRGVTISDKDKLPAVVVFALGEDNEPLPGKHNLRMTVRIECIEKFGSKNPSVVAEAMLGDIIKRMCDPTSDVSGGLAEKVEYTDGGIDEYPEPGNWTIGCYAIFSVNYKTKIGDPYIQSDSLSVSQSETIAVTENLTT